MEGIGQSTLRCPHIGTLHACVRDEGGSWRSLEIPNVRYADQPDSLLSVDQLWEDLNLDVTFRNVRCVVGPHGTRFPFARGTANGDNPGLPEWHMQLSTKATSSTSPRALKIPRALKAVIHRGHTSSHIGHLSAERAGAAMHRRLHIGVRRLRRLAALTSDAPKNLALAPEHSCPFCVEANGTKLPHTGSRYQASRPGRLIHADMVGPFKQSSRGNHYAVVLVDDHSRFKFVYPMKQKSDLKAKMPRFIASFNAKLGERSDLPVRTLGHFHSDNAGEFISQEFTELLDANLVHHSTSPPHIHDRNGVAERAIRSVMEGVRADMVASKMPLGFWDYAMEHSVDILNRTTCPPDSEVTCYESMTGEQPRVMHLMPFGCATWIVKPESHYFKATIDSKSWEGIHLGCSRLSPGGYCVWVPETKRVHVTSDAYFCENLFPWRPKDDRIVGELLPQTSASVAADAPALHDAAEDAAGPAAPKQHGDTASAAFARATHGEAAAAARTSDKVLVLFSGPYQRPDGLGAFLRQQGFDVTLVDSDAQHGGDVAHDLLNDRFYRALRTRIRKGHYFAVFAAPPCSTFSVARHFPPADGKKPGPPPVRTRKFPAGLRPPPKGHEKELATANKIIDRLCVLLNDAHEAGTEFAVENPSDRSTRGQKQVFLHEDHGSLWRYPNFRQLVRSTDACLCTFAQCMFGAEFQKYTTLAYSKGLSPLLVSLDRLRCTHTTHKGVSGGTRGQDGTWTSARAAAYPPDFNLFLARSFRDARFGSTIGEEQPAGGARPSSPDHEDNARRDVGDTEDAEARFEDVADGAATAPPSSPQATAPPARTVPAETAPPVPPSDSGATSKTTRKIPKGDSGDPDDPSSRFFKRAPTRVSGRANVGRAVLRMGAFTSLGEAFSFRRTSGKALRAAAAPAADSTPTPKNHWDAVKLDELGWTTAESKEFTNHRTNQSWEVIARSELPRGRKLVKMTWVYKVKRDGTLKARLCVQGCTQIAGVDYSETFCSTMRGSTLRSVCAAAAKWDLHMRRWDFVAAYLQGQLDEGETVYCSLPPGYPNEKTADGQPAIYKIKKPVYGMAQAGRRWQRSLFPWLKEIGFTQHESDDCLFSKVETRTTPQGPREERLILGCYVDDLFTAYTHDDEHSLYHDFTRALQKRWEVEDEGVVKDLLAVEIV